MKKEAARRKARRASPILEALEPRVLLSADLPGVGEISPDRDQDLEPSVEEILADAEAALVQVEAAANASSAAQAQDASPAESSNEAAGGLLPPSGAGGATRHELVVVDPDVPAYEQLISGLKGQSAEGTVFDIVMLDPQRQGLGQISEILAARGGLDAMHLISHGADGEFRLGGDCIDLAVLQQDADAVRAWGSALRADADILIYGCDLASTAEGELLADTLAQLTGADVAASDDLTGHASLGGDWDLEYQAGVIDAQVAVSEPIQGTWTATLDAPVANDDPGAFSADVLSLNPVSYWRLGETSGTSVTDIGSVGNATGTYNGPSLGESDPINGDPDSAAGFNRTELDYIEIAHDDAYLLDEGTVQLWFNADDLAQDQALFSKDSSGPDTGGHLTIRVLTDGSVETRLQSTSGDNFVYSGVGSVTAGNWHHIAFTFGSGGMQLYLDGNRVDTNPYTGGLGTTSGDVGNYEPIAIGAGTRTSGDGTVTPLNDYFDGRIDEVAIFGTALSGADINRLSGGALQNYTLDENTSLSVVASEGVLANDFDEEGDPLTAILVSGPANAASFALNADGSFSYTPVTNFSGTDSFTYRADDGTAGSSVATVTITVNLLNDTPSAVADTYTATEDTVLASNTEWFDGNWQYRKTISFDNSLRPENLIDFPVLIMLDSSRIDYNDTQDQGQDLRFFDADGTPLAHEIETWNEGGKSYVWVKVPQIDASSATDSIWMYYGNGSVSDGQNPAAVWSEYHSVYHLNENPGATGTVTDSAGNFDAINAGTTNNIGKIGDAQQFNGTGDYIDLGPNRDWINSTTSSTLSIWMNADATSGGGDMLGVSVNGAPDTSSSRIAINRSGDDITLVARTMDDSSDVIIVTTSSNPLTAGEWHLVTGTVDYASDTNNIKIYVDGALEATFSHDFTNNAIPATNSANAKIGVNEDGGSSYFDGTLDEARIAAKLRSADWVSAQYASMTDNFATFGYVQTVSGVLGNDVDPDNGDMLTVSAVNGNATVVGNQITLASGALLTVNADGSFTWDPNGAFEYLGAGASTTDSFNYTVRDGTGATDTTTVTITVNGVDDPSVVSGIFGGAVTEGDVGDAPVTATGTISVSDVDVDDNPVFNDVGATVGDNGYGSFVLTSGTWTYTLDQSAVQNLDVGDVVNDTITYTATDGTTQQITVTITGTDDASVISGTVTGAVNEGNISDAPVTATGTISISDADDDDSPSFADVGSTVGDNGYGSFVLTSSTWTYILDQSAVQNLDAGDVVNDTITYTATNGSTQQITVTITGTDDASVISGTITGAVNEGNVGDAPVTATGSISISDADDNDSPTFNDVASTLGDNGYGSFVLTSGTWTYTLDQSAVQNLDAGDVVNDTITYTATNGSTQQITVSITGTDDASVISGTVTGAVNEGNIGDAPVTATGTTSISDADDDDSPSFTDVGSTVGDNGYGSFVLTSGTWTYTLDQSTVQNLDAGDVVNDTITYTATDGSTQTVTITIDGAEDAPVIGGISTGSVAEDGTLTANGTLTISDVDTSDNPVSFPDEASTLGDNGYGDFALTAGAWTYTLNNADASVQALDVGESLTDTHTFTASDGSTQTVTITINGAEDAPVIGGTATGTVAEDGTLTANGTLTISDVDASDNPISFPDEPSTLGDNGYGDFALTAGTWTYTLDNAHPAVRALNVGESLIDTHAFTATDGSTQVVSITIAGSSVAAPFDPGLTREPPGGNLSGAEPEDQTDEPQVAGEAPVGEDAVLQAQAPLSSGGGLPETGEATMLNGVARIGDDGATDLLQPIVPDELLLEVVTDRDAERRVHSQIDKPDVRTAQRLLGGLGSLEKVASVAAMTEVGGHGSQTEVFWHDLEQMAQDMERAAEEEGERLKLSAETAAGVTLSLTAGVVSWVLRAGSLVASFLTVMPTWRHFDPMPILSADEPADRATPDDDPEGPDEPAEGKKVVEETQVEALFDR